jgi:flavin reductase (DIM6/NTAB) family NADH-FMN oxidoreductase RutF
MMSYLKSLGAVTAALPLPAWVIACYDAAGKPTAMTASWAGVCCSAPPLLYFSVRESRYTWECVQARRAFTINIPGADQARAVDYLGIASGRDGDKLAAAGIGVEKSSLVDAPILLGFPLVVECTLHQALPLGSHIMCIGEVRDAKCEEALLGPEGRLDAAKLAPFFFSPPDGSYYAAGDKLGRAYALGKGLGG